MQNGQLCALTLVNRPVVKAMQNGRYFTRGALADVLYALADRRDKHHARCADWLQRAPDVLMVPATVLAETCYLIDRTLGPATAAAFLDSVGTGPGYTFQLVKLVDSDLRRMSGLVHQYADLRLGGTDASVTPSASGSGSSPSRP
jgi:predicted nucleic acid-binding protein